MKKQDVYNYFTLSAQLHETVTNWIKETVKNTYYKDCPMDITNIANIGGGQLGVKVDFQVPPCNDFVQEIYKINIDDLENY